MEKASSSSSSKTPLGNASNLLNVPSGRVVKHSTEAPVAAKVSKASHFTEFIQYAKSHQHNLDRAELNLFNCVQRCDSMLDNFKDCEWVLENRAGFSFKNNHSGHANLGGPMPPREEYKPKLNVWIAFSSNAICTPFIQRVGEKFDVKVYESECVDKRLVPFIKENHEDLGDTVLWSDLSMPYASKSVSARLDAEGINFVEKVDNAGCRVKCFTYFWTLLRNKVYQGNWQANNEDELRLRILHCLRTLDMRSVARIANDTEERINEMATTGKIRLWSDKTQNYTGSH